MRKRRMAESGEVNVYVNETADVAILTMPVREAVMLMALASKCGGPDELRPAGTFDALCAVFGWDDVSPRDAAQWHARLMASFGLSEPYVNEHGVTVFDRIAKGSRP